MNKLKHFHSSDKQDWVTPQFIFDALDKEFGFTLDVCANDSNAKCEKYFTEKDNSLTKDWFNDVCFMNPPCNLANDFMKKAWDESRKGAIVVCLVPETIDSKFWDKYFMQRLEFEGHKKNRATFPSAIVILKPSYYSIGFFDITNMNVAIFAKFKI
jgi:phage N-6-adenine-methyltransferase